MKVQYLMMDHSLALAAVIIEIFRPCLREEEIVEARGMVIEACKAAFISYEEKTARAVKRVKPSKN